MYVQVCTSLFSVLLLHSCNLTRTVFFFFVKSHFYLITAIPGLLWLQVLETSFKIAEGKKWNVVIDMTESLEYSASNTAGCRGSSGGHQGSVSLFRSLGSIWWHSSLHWSHNAYLRRREGTFLAFIFQIQWRNFG